jgi:hypothetical protein
METFAAFLATLEVWVDCGILGCNARLLCSEYQSL